MSESNYNHAFDHFNTCRWGLLLTFVCFKSGECSLSGRRCRTKAWIWISEFSSSPSSSFSQTTQSLSPLTRKPLSRQQRGVDFRAGTSSVHGDVKLVPVWSVTLVLQLFPVHGSLSVGLFLNIPGWQFRSSFRNWWHIFISTCFCLNWWTCPSMWEHVIVLRPLLRKYWRVQWALSLFCHRDIVVGYFSN